MNDAVKNLQEVQDFYNNAIKGKIGRREAEKRISKLKNKYGKNILNGYTTGLKPPPYNKQYLDELSSKFTTTSNGDGVFLKHLAAVGEDVNANKNIFKRYKNTITGKNIANTKEDIKNFKDNYYDLDTHLLQSLFLNTADGDKGYYNYLANNRDNTGNTVESASKYLNKLKRNRALAIAGTAAVPLAAAGIGYGLYRHNKKKKWEEENMNKSAYDYIDMIEKIAEDATEKSYDERIKELQSQLENEDLLQSAKETAGIGLGAGAGFLHNKATTGHWLGDNLAQTFKPAVLGAIGGKIGNVYGEKAKKRVNDELVQVKLDKLINNK